MDAIKSVENEVDKVLRLFSTCKDTCDSKIDQLIKFVEKSKQDIDNLSTRKYYMINCETRKTDVCLIIRIVTTNHPSSFASTSTAGQTEINSRQALLIKDICDNVQKLCAQITNTHRELHVPVSKIGKSIDKNFSVDFGCVADPKLFHSSDNKDLLNHAIIQHLLRHGMAGVAEELVKEANLKIDSKELLQFNEVTSIVSSLRNKDVNLALKWAVRNRARLLELNSPLEFKIHRIKMIELYKQGIDKKHDIIRYARDNLQPLNMYELDIQHLMGAMLYLKTGIAKSPYKYLLDPINYDEIEEIFVTNACAMMNLSTKSPLSVVVDAGCVALPALLNINQILMNQGVQDVWHMRDELPVEIDLGRKLQFHSTFSCPILKQQSTENNPPMRLVCGHVISRDALHKLSSSSTQNKLKCPYCPMEQVLSDAKQIHF